MENLYSVFNSILVVVAPAPIIAIIIAPAGNVNNARGRLIILLRRVIGLLLRVIGLLWVVHLLGRTVIRSGIGLARVVTYHCSQGGCSHSSIALPHLGTKQAACYST